MRQNQRYRLFNPIKHSETWPFRSEIQVCYATVVIANVASDISLIKPKKKKTGVLEKRDQKHISEIKNWPKSNTWSHLNICVLCASLLLKTLKESSEMLHSSPAPKVKTLDGSINPDLSANQLEENRLSGV